MSQEEVIEAEVVEAKEIGDKEVQQKYAVVHVEEVDKKLALVGDFKQFEFGQLVELFTDPKNFIPATRFAKELAKNLVADPTTKEGEKSIKSTAKKIGEIEKNFSAIAMDVKRALKAKPNQVDECCRTIVNTLQNEKAKVLAPLKEIEERRALLVEIDNMPAQTSFYDAAGCDMLLEQLESKVHDEKWWKESWNDAQYSINEAKRQITDIRNQKAQAEADAKELEERRKKDAEENARKLKEAEDARKKAEEEAARAKAAEEEAKRKAQQAEDDKAAAEAARQAAEAKVPEWVKSEEKASEERLFPESEYDRKKRCNNEALEAIAKITKDKAVAKAVVIAIAKGQIPHVLIRYEV